MSNKHNQIKVLAASLLMTASWNASAAIGGLQVQSGLNEPFSATVVVTGDEARALTSAKPAVTGADLNASVVQQSADRAVIRLQSTTPVKEPMLTFWLSVGSQNRQYTAMLDPRDYRSPAASSGSRERGVAAEREVRRPPERRAEAGAPRNAPVGRQRRASAPEIISGSAYQVKDGELLVNIAERVQPTGVTLRQTINALVRLNPQSFRNRNPDLMYRGTTLIIPDEAQLRRVAQNPRLSVRAQSAAGAPAVSLPERAGTAPAPAPQTATPPAPVTPPAPPPVVASAPAETAPPATVSEAPAAASAPVSEPLQVASEVAVSAVLPADPISEVASAPVPAPEPQPAAPAVEQSEPVEEEGGLMTWLPYGVGGAVVLGGLGYYALQRRRKSGNEVMGQEAEEDELFFDEESNQALGEANGTPDDELHIDLSHLADQHLGDTPDSGFVAAQMQEDFAPTTPPADEPVTETEEDWSWLGEEEATAQTQTQQSVADVATSVSDDSWLDFGEESVAAVATESAPAAAAPAVAEVDEDLSWIMDVEETFTPAVESAQTTEPVRNAEPAAEDDWLSDLDVLLEDTPAAAPAPAATAAADDQWDMNIDLSVNEETESAASSVSNGFDVVAEDLDFNLNFVDEPVVETPVAAAPAPEPQSAPDLAFEGFESFAPQAFAAEEVVSLNLDAEPAPTAPAALPQEALEAKLELARMYLEIDDANTARHTLMELINESNGSSIQAQARALLNELS